MAKTSPRPLVPAPGAPPRYSTRPLPPYRHVPGLTPHPVKDPAGHLHRFEDGGVEILALDLPSKWHSCQEYLYGVDLFNRVFLWEAHELWEPVWIAAGKKTEPGRFVQGLIQVAAGLLRMHLQTPAGARSLVDKAWRKVEPIEAGLAEIQARTYMGVPITAWKRSVERYLRDDGSPYPFLSLRPNRPRARNP